MMLGGLLGTVGRGVAAEHLGPRMPEQMLDIDLARLVGDGPSGERVAEAVGVHLRDAGGAPASTEQLFEAIGLEPGVRIEATVAGVHKQGPRRLAADRGVGGERGGLSDKAAVIGVKDRETGQVRAQAIDSTDGETLRGFVRENARPGSQVYSDGHGAYTLLEGEYKHAAVQHSVGTYVIEQAHTNGIESFWSMLKRSYIGSFHQMSEKHLQRYVSEFAGRHNARPLDTTDQMRRIARGLVGKRLQYRELTA